MHPITEKLLAWYDLNAREMPWRGISDAYGTWVSEIMLQQTRVDTVRHYYPRFMDRFPTLRDLAEAPEEAVLKQWEGLGYYSRARNLRLGARQVMAEYGGEIPRDPAELRKISGIGAYTAAAVASIAYGVPVPAVDGNVIRVICRLYQIEENPLEGPVRARVETLAGALVPAERAGDHNQAMMDLGATVCVPGTPDCDSCPLRERCAGYEAGAPESLPRLPQGKLPKEILYDVPVLRSGGRVLMRRREEKLLQGLWCFPLLEGRREPAELETYLTRKMRLPLMGLKEAGEGRHVFTHQIWRMRLFEGEVPPDTPAPKGYEWIPAASLRRLPLPVAMKAARKLLEDKEVEDSKNEK